MLILGLDLAVLLWFVSELPVEVDLLHVEPVSDEAAGQFGVRLELAVHERPHGCGINPVLSERLQLPVIALLVDRQLHPVRRVSPICSPTSAPVSHHA